MNKSKFIQSTLFAVLSVILFGSCMDNNQEPTPIEPNFSMTIFNAYSPVAGVMPQIENRDLLNTGSSLQYADYIQFNSSQVSWFSVGEIDFNFLNPSTNQLLTPVKSFTTEDNGTYSWFMYGLPNETKHIIVEDLPLETTDATPKIRFFNLANETGSVDFYLGEDEVSEFSNREQETEASAAESSRYFAKSAPAGTSISIKNANGEDVANLTSYNFQANRYYTVVLVGNPDEDDETEAEKPYQIKVYLY